ncbi:MAG: response regulator transcription factor [Chloroflexi bacterium]|nr:response regulator transcription factor [Chloroflexota bacterium]
MAGQAPGRRSIKILLVDDSNLLRTALANLLSGENGLRVVAQAANGEEAIQRALETFPDLVLMDVRMPVCDGITATRRIKEALPDTRVIMLSVSDDNEDLFEALKAGAEGYLLKTVETEELVATIQRLAAGDVAFSPPMATRILREFVRQLKSTPPLVAPRALTAREEEVLRMVSQGYTNQDVAQALHLTQGTVKGYLHTILEKLHVRNRTEAAAWLRQGAAPR